MVISLARPLLSCQQIPTEPKIDLTQMGVICLPKLFRTMTTKRSVDAPPHILLAHLELCLHLGIWACWNSQAPASFCLGLRVESKQNRQEKCLSGDLSAPRSCPPPARDRCGWIISQLRNSLGKNSKTLYTVPWRDARKTEPQMFKAGRPLINRDVLDCLPSLAPFPPLTPVRHMQIIPAL